MYQELVHSDLCVALEWEVWSLILAGSSQYSIHPLFSKPARRGELQKRINPQIISTKIQVGKHNINVLVFYSGKQVQS